MKEIRIVTHPGSAHFDEFFAISLILAVNDSASCQVERREPLPEELGNPAFWVVDIGGRHEPHLKNFDHHQDRKILSSFRIVADYLGVSETLSVLSWWDYKDKIDRFGPIRVGEEMGTKNLSITYSPFEEWYLEVFSETPLECLPLMKAFGRSMLRSAESLFSGINYWKNADQIQVKHKTCLIGQTDDLTGAEEYLARLGPPFSVTISHDRRGEGWTLKRYHEDKGVDFSKIKEHPAIKFAHQGGFIAKTRSRIPLTEVLDLVSMAVE